MRKNKWIWFWGPSTQGSNMVVFQNSDGRKFHRYGYQHSDATTFCDYINTRG